MKVYSMRDTVADVYNGLYMFSNDAVACRWFGAVLESDDKIVAFKNDMQLFRVGEFNMDTGMLDVENPVLIMKGADHGIQE